ncbi:hypothetical protein R3P38DRAFT_3201453 [Favolaschia claudopus]|uniref:Uncharacterized protein n=1 Tax=Favolaschia claudopus TaxID=2862362 RepID=A0AAW0AX58_9AGAR
MAITRRAKAEATRTGKPTTRSRGKTTTSTTATKESAAKSAAVRARARTEKKAASKSTEKEAKRQPARKQPRRGKKATRPDSDDDDMNVDKPDEDDTEAEPEPPQSPPPRRHIPTPLETNDDMDVDKPPEHDIDGDRPQTPAPPAAPPRHVQTPSPKPQTPSPEPQTPEPRTSRPLPQTPHSPGPVLFSDAPSPVQPASSPPQVMPESPRRTPDLEFPPSPSIPALPLSPSPKPSHGPRPKPRARVLGMDYNRDENFVISRGGGGLWPGRREQLANAGLLADRHQFLTNGDDGDDEEEDWGPGSGLEQNVDAQETPVTRSDDEEDLHPQEDQLPAHDLSDDGYVDVQTSPVRHDLRPRPQAKKPTPAATAADEESGTSGSDYEETKKNQRNQNQQRLHPRSDTESRDAASDREEEEGEAAAARARASNARRHIVRKSGGKSKKPESSDSDSEGRRTRKPRAKKRTRKSQRDGDSDQENPKAKAKGKGKEKEKDDAPSDDESGEEAGSKGRSGPIPQETLDKLALLDKEYDEKVAELAKECGKSVESVYRCMGDRKRVGAGESPWNVYQSWYAAHHPNEGKFSGGEYSKHVRQEFIDALGPDFPPSDRRDFDAVYAQLQHLKIKEWYEDYKAQLILDLRNEGKLRTRVREQMKPIYRLMKVIQEEYGFFLCGSAVDPRGHASFNFGVGDEYLAVKNMREQEFQSQLEDMEFDFRLVQKQQAADPEQHGGADEEPPARLRQSRQVKPKKRDDQQMQFRAILSAQLYDRCRAADKLEPNQTRANFPMQWSRRFLDTAYETRSKIINYPKALQEADLIIGRGNWQMKKVTTTMLETFLPGMISGSENCMKIVEWDPEDMALSLTEQGDLGVIYDENGRVVVAVSESGAHSKALVDEANSSGGKQKGKGKGKEKEKKNEKGKGKADEDAGTDLGDHGDEDGLRSHEPPARTAAPTSRSYSAAANDYGAGELGQNTAYATDIPDGGFGFGRGETGGYGNTAPRRYEASYGAGMYGYRHPPLHGDARHTAAPLAPPSEYPPRRSDYPQDNRYPYSGYGYNGPDYRSNTFFPRHNAAPTDRYEPAPPPPRNSFLPSSAEGQGYGTARSSAPSIPPFKQPPVHATSSSSRPPAPVAPAPARLPHVDFTRLNTKARPAPRRDAEAGPSRKRQTEHGDEAGPASKRSRSDAEAPATKKLMVRLVRKNEDGVVERGMTVEAVDLKEVAEQSAADRATVIYDESAEKWRWLPAGTAPVIVGEYNLGRWQRQLEMWNIL